MSVTGILSKQHQRVTVILSFTSHCISLSSPSSKLTNLFQTYNNKFQKYSEQQFWVARYLKSYSLVVFPDIWMMHLLSFPISLELKGRTLTATFTEAPAMMQESVLVSGRARDVCGYTDTRLAPAQMTGNHCINKSRTENLAKGCCVRHYCTSVSPRLNT